MSILSWTVRDFAKAREGKDFLRQYFDFSKYPAPKLDPPVAFPQGADVNIVGKAFDILLPLLVHRKNKQSVNGKAPAFYWLRPKELREFTKSQTPSDELLNQAIKAAIDSHKSFAWATGAKRPRPNQNIRQALALLFERADSLDWTATNICLNGSLCGFGILDLLLDRTAIEVKTVKDAGHHSEHTAQLLAYYLLARLPAARDQGTVIDRIGIYYSRHGVLASTPVAAVRQSGNQDMDVVAAKFYEMFIRWAVDKRYDGYESDFKPRFLRQQLKLGLHAAGLSPMKHANVSIPRQTGKSVIRRQMSSTARRTARKST